MRVIKSGIAALLCAAMVITLAPASAGAAKKPSVAKKASVEVGKTTTIKVKNAAKNAKVKWTTSSKKVAKIAKQVKSGKKASVTVKGVAEGKATIKGAYKAGKVKKTLKTTVTVSAAKADVPAPTTAADSAAPSASAAVGTKAPTAKPTKGPTNTPKPSATPSPVPKNGAVKARKLTVEDTITVDGTIGADEYANADAANYQFDLLKNAQSKRGDVKVTDAKALLMWDDSNLYCLVTYKGGTANDKLTLYTADGTTVVKGDGVVKASGSDYVAEAKVALKSPKVGGSAKIEIQLTSGGTVNYYDSITKLEYNKEANKWNLKDEGITADKDTKVYGSVTFDDAMALPKRAFYATQGAQMLAQSGMNNVNSLEADGALDPSQENNENLNDGITLKSYKMKKIDTTYWTNAYGTKAPITFQPEVVPEFASNAEKASFSTTASPSKEEACAYTIYDENYLYVLFVVKDSDIAPASSLHYDTDSVEFFLDEDSSRETTYPANKDAVQLRLDAANGALSCNSEGSATNPAIGHYVEKTSNGYIAEFVIKFNKAHTAGEIMGMDLQINDCFTTVGDDGVSKSERAGTLTAYDTTNTAYKDPSVFGRIKLMAK